MVSEAFRDENDDKFKESLALIEKPKIQSLFDGYYYDYKSSAVPTKHQITQAAHDKSEEMEKSNPEIQEEIQYNFDKQ